MNFFYLHPLPSHIKYLNKSICFWYRLNFHFGKSISYFQNWKMKIFALKTKCHKMKSHIHRAAQIRDKIVTNGTFSLKIQPFSRSTTKFFINFTTMFNLFWRADWTSSLLYNIKKLESCSESIDLYWRKNAIHDKQKNQKRIRLKYSEKTFIFCVQTFLKLQLSSINFFILQKLMVIS